MRPSSWRPWTGLVLAALVLSPVLARPSAAKDASDEAAARSQRAWLGVYTQPLDSDLRDEFKYRGDGVLVNRVVPDSPADKAGIEKGDIITSFNGHSVTSPSALADAVTDGKDGQSVSVRLVRDGQPKTITAKLATRETDEDAGPGDVEVEIPKAMHDMGDMGDMHDMAMGLPGVMRWMGRGRLGVQTGELNPDLGSYFGVPSGKGVLVMSVVKESPAEKAGIKAGDVITKVNDKSVADAGELIEALPSDGGKVAVTVVRKGATRTLSAEIEKSENTIRVRRGDGGTRTWSWRNDDDHGPNVIRLRDRQGDDELRRQVDELRREIDRLRAEMERLKK